MKKMKERVRNAWCGVLSATVAVLCAGSAAANTESHWAALQRALSNADSASLTCDPFEHRHENGTNFVKLLKDVVCDDQSLGALAVPAGVNTVLDLNGFLVNRALSSFVKNGYVLSVSGSLTIEDGSSVVRKFAPDSEGFGSDQAGKGWLLLPDEDNGTRTLTGGAITGGRNSNTSGRIDSTGGILVNSGATLVLAGGNVAGNMGYSEYSMLGGGVGNDGTVVMTGGAIAGNVSFTGGSWSAFGGGVANNGTFDLCDGEIKWNRTGNRGNATSSTGGGVSNTGTFRISGGAVTGNEGYFCGGIDCRGGTLTMTAGSVDDNNGTGAGGMRYTGGTLTVGGSARIFSNRPSSNLYINSGKKVAIAEGADAPVSGMYVGVTTQDKPSAGKPIQFTQSGTEDDLAWFASDSSSYIVEHNKSGYIQLAIAPPIVTLDAQGGTGGTPSVTPTAGEPMPEATMPTRTGYKFLGYFDAAIGGTQYYNADGSGTRVWDRVVKMPLYARWEANTYVVSLPDGTQMVATYDQRLPNVMPPVKDGYSFAGYADEDGTMYYTSYGTPTAATWTTLSDVTLVSQWTVNSYTVTFDQQGGAGGAASVIATYDEVYPKVDALPTKTGHTFLGYYEGTDEESATIYNSRGISTNVYKTAGGSTLWAKWKANTYALTLDGWSFTGKVSVTYGTRSPAVHVPVREGYVFRGYVNGDDVMIFGADGKSTLASYEATSDQVLTAQWERLPEEIVLKSAKQRWPWNGKYDVTYEVDHLDPEKRYAIAGDFTLGETSGTAFADIPTKSGEGTVVLDAGEIFPVETLTDEAKLTLRLVIREGE